MARAMLLPVRQAYGVGKLSAKAGYRTGRLSALTSYRAGRLLGYRRMATLAIGVAVGVLLAPASGRETRGRLRRMWEDWWGRASDADVAERVRHELAQSPRTWHLPQPTVEVVGGKAILTGGAPHSTGRTDIERAVAAVPGVVEIENRLVVDVGGNGGTDH